MLMGKDIGILLRSGIIVGVGIYVININLSPCRLYPLNRRNVNTAVLQKFCVGLLSFLLQRFCDLELFGAFQLFLLLSNLATLCRAELEAVGGVNGYGV